MTNILQQPYSIEQYAQFAGQANQNRQRIELQDGNAYALAEYEKLENGIIIDLRDDSNYKAAQLSKFKAAKLAENEQKRQVEFITISLGRMKTETPLGDLKTALPLYEKLAKASNGLPAGAVRLYDNNGNLVLSPELTYEQVEAVMLEISLAYIQIDQKSTQYCSAIENAQTLAELENIEITYGG